MNKLSSKNVGRTILHGILIFIVIASYALAAVLHRDTLVDWWIPSVTALALAMVTGTILWRKWGKITDSDNFLFNYICHTIFFSGLFVSAIYGINRAFPRESTRHEIKAVVERKYAKTRHHRQRVSRNVYKQGTPYKVYYLSLQLPDGRTKELQVPLTRFNRTRSGSSIPLSMQQGFFGMTIIGSAS